MYNRTLVSKKLPGIRLLAVDLEVSRETAPESAETLQQLRPARLACDRELPLVRNMDLDIIAFLELQRFDHDGWKANGETVTPFSDLHDST